MSQWVGYAVSVSCGEPLGCYQGTVAAADGATLTLARPFRNGFPYPEAQVTLNAADIRTLRIIESAPARGAAHSTVPLARRAPRAPVCEALQAPPAAPAASTDSVTGSQKAGGAGGAAGGAAGARSRPIDIQSARNTSKSSTLPPHAGSYSNAGSTPKRGGGGGYQAAARRRNEACFGSEAAVSLEDDFDFEGNLALFDKRALAHELSGRPDVVRAADGAEGRKFRHDENVLGGAGAAAAGRRAIRVPDVLRGARDYVTDEGVVVPSAAPRLRRQLWEGMARAGLAGDARLLTARAAADVALRLAGGGRRLEPANAHQAPACVALCGAHAGGAAGLAAARLLAAHGVRVHVHVVEGGAAGEAARELAALALSGVAPEPLEALPRADVVLLALPDAARCRPALAWARAARSALVCVEPPADGWAGEEVAARASVCALLPPALPAALGRVYLAAAAPPASLFAELHVSYRPPFGAATVLALHPADE